MALEFGLGKKNKKNLMEKSKYEIHLWQTRGGLTSSLEESTRVEQVRTVEAAPSQISCANQNIAISP